MTPLSPPQFHQTWTSASIFWNHSYLLTKPTAPNITNPLTPHFFHAHNHPWALAFSYPSPPHTSSLCSLPSSIHEAMRDRRMERFTLLPFSIGCVSQSSVSVIDDQPKNPHAEPTSAPPNGEDNGQCNGKPRSSFGLSGLQKLIKSFKSLSQFFVVYEEDEEEEREMEIGLPTDVQHVGHIGWDGLNNLSSMKSWDRAPELLSLPSLSMRQFELSMAAQAVVPPQSTLCSKQAWP